MTWAYQLQTSYSFGSAHGNLLRQPKEMAWYRKINLLSVFPHLQRNKNCASTITNSFATFEIGVISSVLHKKLSINCFPFINFNEQSDHNEKEKKLM